MYNFKNDYAEGAHPRILQALIDTNLEQTEGYGEDQYCLEAANFIKKKMGRDDVDIHFIPGGAPKPILSPFLLFCGPPTRQPLHLLRAISMFMRQARLKQRAIRYSPCRAAKGNCARKIWPGHWRSIRMNTW